MSYFTKAKQEKIKSVHAVGTISFERAGSFPQLLVFRLTGAYVLFLVCSFPHLRKCSVPNHSPCSGSWHKPYIHIAEEFSKHKLRAWLRYCLIHFPVQFWPYIIYYSL